MKRLLAVFLFLLVTATLLTLAGIRLAGGRVPFGAPAVLAWTLDGDLVEQAPPGFFRPPGVEPPASFAAAFRALRSAREDGSVRGLAVFITDPHFGLGKAQEVRHDLLALASAGKFVECYLPTAGEGGNGTLAYYVATACQRVHMAPAGDLNLLGLYADSPFLRGSLDKLEIEPEFDQVGPYKSAPELYTEKRHSEPAREEISALLDSAFAEIVTSIGAARKLPDDTVRQLIDGAPYTAQEALALGLVDDLIYPDEFRSRLSGLVGEEPDFVDLTSYRYDRGSGRKIAVLFAQGTIVRGNSGEAPWTGEVYLGADDLSEELRRLAADRSIAAVVLRIDSPGGSALASDLILRQVERLASKKPVIASLSDVAASGGYYIAVKATKIVAEPSTLTGSIGVFSGKLVSRGFQNDLLGITHETAKRGANADLYSSLEPYRPEQRERVRAMLQQVYDTFVGHVAAGRHLPREKVEALAGGRVWTGSTAREVGLVDELGGLDRAIQLASQAAGIGENVPIEVVYYPAPRGALAWLLADRRPRLPAELAALLEQIRERSPRILEAPPDAVSLAHPF